MPPYIEGYRFVVEAGSRFDKAEKLEDGTTNLVDPKTRQRTYNQVAETNQDQSSTIAEHSLTDDESSIGGSLAAADSHVSECVVCCERPPSWIFKSCGHKCICKPCARKQKYVVTAGASPKKGQRKVVPMVACPLCRALSHVVPCLRHEGQIFET